MKQENCFCNSVENRKDLAKPARLHNHLLMVLRLWPKSGTGGCA
jgi:hypothetical protein